MPANAYPMKTLPELGAAFRALRKQSGKTQVELALAVGMRQEALSRFESGRAADFSTAKLLRLLQALSLDLELRPATRRPTLADVLQERRENANTGPDSR